MIPIFPIKYPYRYTQYNQIYYILYILSNNKFKGRYVMILLSTQTLCFEQNKIYTFYCYNSVATIAQPTLTNNTFDTYL